MTNYDSLPLWSGQRARSKATHHPVCFLSAPSKSAGTGVPAAQAAQAGLRQGVKFNAILQPARRARHHEAPRVSGRDRCDPIATRSGERPVRESYEPWMRIATFNINNIKRRLPNLLDWLNASKPDVICLQELKCSERDFPAAPIKEAGYSAVWCGEKTWNGVAILARHREPVLKPFDGLSQVWRAGGVGGTPGAGSGWRAIGAVGSGRLAGPPLPTAQAMRWSVRP